MSDPLKQEIEVYMQQRIFLVGTGSAGTALALWLSRRGHRLVGAWNRSSAAANAAESILSLSVSTGAQLSLPECDLVLVAVSDDAIAEVAAQLQPLIRPGMIVAHVSGSRSASELGVQVVPRGSLHPLMAMRSPEVAARGLDRALFTVEGDPGAVSRLTGVIEGAGARVQRLDAAGKAAYHAAAVMASNLAVALVAEAAKLAESVGIRDGERAFAELAAVAIENVIEHGATTGLTGPLTRGDVATVRDHLDALSGPTREIYRRLSLRGLALARARGLSGEAHQALEALLGDIEKNARVTTV